MGWGVQQGFLYLKRRRAGGGGIRGHLPSQRLRPTSSQCQGNIFMGINFGYDIQCVYFANIYSQHTQKYINIIHNDA